MKDIQLLGILKRKPAVKSHRKRSSCRAVEGQKPKAVNVMCGLT